MSIIKKISFLFALSIVCIIGIHEIFLFSFGERINFFKYYPVSPRPIFPEVIDYPDFRESNNFISIDDSEILKVNLEVSNYDLYSFFGGISSIGYNFFIPKSFGSDWWNWNANYHQRGKSWQTIGTLSIKNKTNEFLNGQSVAVRINGNTSRAFPQKSFRIYFKEKLGLGKVDFPFGDSNCRSATVLVARNLGANWGNLYSIDAIIQESVPRKDIVLRAQPISFFLNNEFWGIYYLRNKISLNEDEKKQKTTIIKPQTMSYKAELKRLDSILKIEDDSTAYQTFCNQVDIESFMYMFFIQTFFGNADWPGANLILKKSDKGKIKFHIKDLDLAFGKTITSDGYDSLYNFDWNQYLQLNKRFLTYDKYVHDYDMIVTDYFESEYFEKELIKAKNSLSSYSFVQAARWDKLSQSEIDGYVANINNLYQIRKQNFLRYWNSKTVDLIN